MTAGLMSVFTAPAPEGTARLREAWISFGPVSRAAWEHADVCHVFGCLCDCQQRPDDGVYLERDANLLKSVGFPLCGRPFGQRSVFWLAQAIGSIFAAAVSNSTLDTKSKTQDELQ
ncbi:MAG: hypothetical protein JO001_09345 [Alphaproteobacteria bacterium]|nr:hypothetical protein [Alphaproteobacteria bacterium]